LYTSREKIDIREKLTNINKKHNKIVLLLNERKSNHNTKHIEMGKGNFQDVH